MKNLILILIFFLPVILDGKTNETQNSGKTEAYYFHFTLRCVTCIAVEEQTKNNLEILYPRQIKEGTMSFQSVNLDEPSGKVLGERFHVAGQTILIVKGNKRINLTNEGFLYATTNPGKLKSVMKQKIDDLLGL